MLNTARETTTNTAMAIRVNIQVGAKASFLLKFPSEIQITQDAGGNRRFPVGRQTLALFQWRGKIQALFPYQQFLSRWKQKYSSWKILRLSLPLPHRLQ